jgi:hypothetical protein
MSKSTEDSPSGATEDRQWFIVSRWQEYDAEARANLLRIVGIGAFYMVELGNYAGFRLGPLQLPPVEGVDVVFHRAVTAAAIAWVTLCLGVLMCLKRGIFPSWLKFISTSADVVMLTAVLTIADGPRSPLVVGYFLVLALAALRLHLPLLGWTTAGSMAAYLFLLGHDKWFRQAQSIPRYHQIIFLLSLLLVGVVLGQVVRRVRPLAEEFSRRQEACRRSRP